MKKPKLKLKKNDYKGRLIAFEGTDGAGKTTMIEMTKTLLGEDNVLFVKQPTDMARKTKLFQKMMYCKDHGDIDYRAVQLLTMSDRLQHGYEVIEPALKEGKTVICDRYVFTSLANMLARGYLNEDWFYSAAKNIVRPDVVFLSYAPPELAIKRIKARPDECDRHLDEDLLKGVAREFRYMAWREKFTVLDTGGDAETAFIKVKQKLKEAGVI